MSELLRRRRARQTPEERWSELRAEVADTRDLAPSDRDVLLQIVVRAAFQTLEDQPRPLRREPPSSDFAGIWERLRARRS